MQAGRETRASGEEPLGAGVGAGRGAAIMQHIVSQNVSPPPPTGWLGRGTWGQILFSLIKRHTDVYTLEGRRRLRGAHNRTSQPPELRACLEGQGGGG